MKLSALGFVGGSVVVSFSFQDWRNSHYFLHFSLQGVSEYECQIADGTLTILPEKRGER